MAATPQLAQDGAVYMGQEGQSGGNMEGKETRLGVTDSAIWAAFTTSASNGAVNSMHDSYTPIGGMVPMILMALGEIIGGGIGCGLYSMIGFVILTVFIAGLMVGRTPEYLGKKIGPREMRMATILCITTPVVILVGAGVMCLDPATVDSLNNGGAHGFSEVLYAAISAGGNNGSAFAGLAADTPMINTVLGLEMLANRFVPRRRDAVPCRLACGAQEGRDQRGYAFDQQRHVRIPAHRDHLAHRRTLHVPRSRAGSCGRAAHDDPVGRVTCDDNHCNERRINEHFCKTRGPRRARSPSSRLASR